MKSREIQDSQNTRWQCVQAFTGITSKTADQAELVSRQSDGTVEVVCTPSGGEQTVRLKLSSDWDSKLSDAELEKCIVNEKG